MSQPDLIVQLNALGMSFPRHNAVIGGDFSTNPWQRGTSFVSPASATVLADRFAISLAGAAVVTITKAADAPTVAQAGKLITHCLMVDVTTADASLAATDVATIRHRIEGYHWVPFAQRELTLHFWHKHTKTGNYFVALRNVGLEWGITLPYTQDVTDTWEEATLHVPASPSSGTWNYTTGVGLHINFVMCSGSDFHMQEGVWVDKGGGFLSGTSQVNAMDNVANNCKFADISITARATRGVIQVRSLEEELVLCQRYFCKSFPLSTVPATSAGTTGAEHFCQSTGASVLDNFGSVGFPTPMRAAPTVTLYNPSAANAQMRNVSTGTDCSATTASIISDKGFTLAATTAGASSAAGNHNAIHWAASAEL